MEHLPDPTYFGYEVWILLKKEVTAPAMSCIIYEEDRTDRCPGAIECYFYSI
jgi:hypothetical protein